MGGTNFKFSNPKLNCVSFKKAVSSKNLIIIVLPILLLIVTIFVSIKLIKRHRDNALLGSQNSFAQELTTTGEQQNETSSLFIKDAMTKIADSISSSINAVSTTTVAENSGNAAPKTNNGGDSDSNNTDEVPITPPPQTITPPPADTCPQSTQNCVPCNAGETYCRFETGQPTGYLGWACQNNNPGNVKYSEYRIGLITSMGGTAPCGSKGGFMVFSTYELGRNSVKAYIRAINAGKHSAYPTCGNCSLLTFFTSYAPNSPQTYTESIVSKMGGDVTQDTLLSWVVENRFDDFINAIQQTEGFFTQ